MNRVLSQARAIFLQLQLFTPSFSTQGVVVVPGFLAYEVDDFQFFLRFGHENILQIGVTDLLFPVNLKSKVYQKLVARLRPYFFAKTAAK